MQVIFLQVTAAGHRDGQGLIGCIKNSVVYEILRAASVLTHYLFRMYLLAERLDMPQ